MPGPRSTRLLSAVDYRGIFNVEFKFDARDGRYKIIEVNPRPFWLIGHIAQAGLDLPWISYLDAQGLPVPVPRPYQIGRYGMYEIPDATAIVRAWSHGRRPDGPVLPNVAARGPGAVLVERPAARGQRRMADPGSQARSLAGGVRRAAGRRTSGRAALRAT